MTGVRSFPSKLRAMMRHPVVTLAFGAITAALGAVVIFWPGHPVLVVSILFGAQLIVSAVFRFIAALGTPEAHQWMRSAGMVAGVIALIAGIFFLRHPYSLGSGALWLGILLGIYWIVTGAIDLFVLVSQPRVPRRGITAVTAILSLIAGIVVIADPAASMNIIAWVLGGFLLVFGVITIVQTLLPRRSPAGP